MGHSVDNRYFLVNVWSVGTFFFLSVRDTKQAFLAVTRADQKVMKYVEKCTK